MNFLKTKLITAIEWLGRINPETLLLLFWLGLTMLLALGGTLANMGK